MVYSLYYSFFYSSVILIKIGVQSIQTSYVNVPIIGIQQPKLCSYTSQTCNTTDPQINILTYLHTVYCIHSLGKVEIKYKYKSKKIETTLSKPIVSKQHNRNHLHKSKECPNLKSQNPMIQNPSIPVHVKSKKKHGHTKRTTNIAWNI